MNFDEKEIRNWYSANKDELDKWGEYVDNILNQYVSTLFSSKEHVQFKAQHRIKDCDSLCEKIFYRKKKYENPLYEVTDKVGTRLVLLNSDDVKKVSEFIVKNKTDWTIVEVARSIDNDILKQPEVFSYQSNHYIVKPISNDFSTIDINYLTCEIQVRTILQHAYAEVSHDTIYKKHVDMSTIVKRKLASSMAFIEAADEKFIEIYNGMELMDDIYTKMQNLIVQLYKDCDSLFEDNKYDVQLSSMLFELLTKKELEEVLSEIHVFYNQKKEFIIEGITNYKENCLLFSQPILIFAAYLIINHQSITIINWPFNYDSLKKLFSTMDISLDVLNDYIQ